MLSLPQQGREDLFRSTNDSWGGRRTTGSSTVGLQNSPLILLVELCEVSVDEMQFKGVVLGAGDGTPHLQDLLFTGR